MNMLTVPALGLFALAIDAPVLLALYDGSARHRSG
jgi:hypothetical protein